MTIDKFSSEYRKMTWEERFFASILKQNSGCWLWQGSLSQGYGHFKIKGKSIAVHRFGYELLKGKIPDGKEIDHLCRNRVCVNPSHLEPVSTKENILRGFGRAAIQARKTHCDEGHLLGVDNLLNRKNRRQCRICNKNDALNWRIKHRDDYPRDSKGRIRAPIMK